MTLLEHFTQHNARYSASFDRSKLALPPARHWAILACMDARLTVEDAKGECAMKWITREHPRVDRVACPWLVERFIEREAEFLYVPREQVITEAAKQKATPYDIEGVELGHHGSECSFDAFVRKYALAADPTMAYMARVIRGADTDDKTITPESSGVEAVLEGIRHLHYPDDQAQRQASKPILDALYAYCQEKTRAPAKSASA